MGRFVSVVAACAVVAACHGQPLPAVPSKGGPAWVELQSEHFTLWTDSSAARGRELIRELEHHRQVVLGVGFASAHAEGRSFVIALRDADEVGVFLPEQFAAYASEGGFLMQPVILMPADADGDRAHLITHELTHVVAFNVIRNQPHWFAEGLASFFETVRLDADKATGDLGVPQRDRTVMLRRHAPTPSAAMFACRQNACMDSMFYATAWALFTFLANTRPADLLRYAERLDQLPESAQAQAWAEVFPDLTPQKLDGELRKWLAYGKHTELTFNVKLQEWPVTERPLRDGDVYAARAVLRYLDGPRGTEPPELAQALAEDPTSLIAQLVRFGIKHDISVQDADRVAAAHPDDWRAWVLVGEAHHWHDQDARTAHDKACALLAAHPSVGAPTDWCTDR